MEKTLVYHLYVNSVDINEKPLYKLHQKCLNIYKDRFDKALFVVTVDDLANTELIGNAIKWILDINFGKEFDIKVKKNDALCESKTFQKYVLDNTNINGMVFFAHNKGSNNFESTNPDLIKDSVFMWVSGMYYYNLNYMDEVNGALCGKKYYPECMYGAFLMEKDIDDDRLFLAPYHYAGNFYWLNIEYYRYLINEKKIPQVVATNPMFSEMFPGYVFSPSPGGGLKTHNDIIWLMSVWDGKFYKMTKKEWEGLGYILDGNCDFIDFVERVSKNIGYCLYD